MVLRYKKIGNGCPLIILHGLYGSGDNWFSFGRALSPYFTVYLVDQRNHGRSPHHAEHNYAVLTSDIEEFLQEHHLEKVCIMGHSMGGKVAMNFALQHPEKVFKLVVIDIAMRSYAAEVSASPQLAIHKKIISALATLDIEFADTREEIDKQLARNLSQKAIRQFLLKNVKRNKTGDFFWSLNIEALKNNLLLLLDKVKCTDKTFAGPVLVISGKNSGYINEADHNDFRKAFPNVEIAEFPAGHWIHSEQPGMLKDKLLEFLPMTENK